MNIANKHGWVHLAFMVKNGTGAKNIFRVVEQIQILDIHHQPHAYFGLMGIGNVVSLLPKPLLVSSIKSWQQIHRKYRIYITGCAQIR